MTHKSLWLVEAIITVIVLLVIGSLVIPQAGTAETSNQPSDAVFVDP